MRWIVLAGLAFFLALFALTTFAPADADIEAQARTHFSTTDIERGREFSFQRRLLFWTGTFLQLAVLAGIVFSGLARKLADSCLTWTRGRWLLAVLLVGAVCYLAEEAVALPVALARLENLRAWGMTRRSTSDWLLERCLSHGLSAVAEGIVLVGLYLLMRCVPRAWPVLAALGGMAVGVVFALILPIWIAPLFNTFTPLEKTEWGYLREPVAELARRGGVPVDEILVMDASRQGSHTNAYFTGFGGTRRIVLYDTLLRQHMKAKDWREVEVILAHEMGHWQHDHIVTGIMIGGVAALAGFCLLSWILQRLVGRPPLRLTSPHDPAGVPLLMLLVVVGTWLAAPVGNAISRHFERQADRVSLEMTRNPEIFIDAEIRLARDNISNVTPNRWSILFMATHPPAVERIRMAEDWKKSSEAGR